MPSKPTKASPRKSAFVPRLAFGCATVGMSVVPLILASGACSNSAAPIGIEPLLGDAGFTGILPYTPPDASPDADAASTGIAPYIPDDAGSDANTDDAHDAGDAATDAGED